DAGDVMAPRLRQEGPVDGLRQCIYTSHMRQRDAVIILRTTGQTKQRLQTAAQLRGQTLTSFVVDAALNQARRPTPRLPDDNRVPRFFRTSCDEACRGGRRSGYLRVGWLFASHLPRL